jgi:alanine racemase
MIMGYIDNSELEWAIDNKIEFFVFEFDRLKTALYEARKLGVKARIHIEVETGMNRTGFLEEQLGKVMQIMQNNKAHYEFAGLCTHYAGAESIANYARIKDQIKRFSKIKKWFKRNGLIPELCHTACSAAAVTYPETRMDMVRSGILQYGFWSSTETFLNYLSCCTDKEDPLQRVITWRSVVMSVKDIKAGEFIGYGTNYIARENMKIATVPVGYALGYSRALSNQGRVLINGSRQDIIGIVNMSLLIVKITEIPDTQKGDEVVLIGYQDDAEITVSSFSDFSNQLNYEMLTRLPSNIPRIIEI